MNLISFRKDLRVTLVTVPCDMRYGFNSLNQLAQTCLNIDISKNNDVVAFISKRRNLCKVIGCDNHGATMIVRKLHEGVYQRILMKATESAGLQLSVPELEAYLNGQELYVAKTSLIA